MRYDDWDVIIFPTGRDAKIPFKEFKVACHVVPDLELVHIHGAVGMPVMTCFVPSLAAGTPFQISLHCWRRPDISMFTRTYSKHSDLVKFEARIQIDGRMVASAVLDRDVNGPHLVTSTFEFTKTGELERLRFPHFRRELLYQNHWNPGDDIGRIKIIISEGFPRDSLSAPIERVKNIVAFSFQHAPLEILETSGIAWPNPSMWRCSAASSVMPVPTYQLDDGPSSHTHSPGKQSVLLRNIKNHGFPPMATTTGMFKPHPNAGLFSNSTMQMPYIGRASAGFGPTPPCSDPSAESSTYLDWINLGAGGQSSDSWDGRSLWPTNIRTTKKQPSDTIMPDYVPPHGADPMHISGSSLEDEPMSLKVPTNTPTGGDADGAQTAQFEVSQHAGSLPPDFATSLTQSLLNQPFPLPTQQQSLCFAPVEAKAGKDNDESILGRVSSAMMQSTVQPVVSEPHLVPPPVFGLDGATLAMSSAQSGREDDASPTLESMFAPSLSNTAGNGDFCILTNSDSQSAGSAVTTPSTAGQLKLGAAAPGASSGGSGSGSATMRRTRNFTPASVKAIDEEDEPRRASPRVRVVGFGAADIPSDLRPPSVT